MRGPAKCALIGVLLLGPLVTQAALIHLGGGWAANVSDPRLMDIYVDVVGDDYVRIEISKDFDDPPVDGVFGPRLVDFIQVDDDANTVSRIIIADESITNLTGDEWTDYHWAVLDAGDAWFNVPLSAGFSTAPFTNKVFSDPDNFYNDPNKASDLDADGGVVPHLGTFFPGAPPGNGELVMDVSLSDTSPVSFTLKQFPTPEPGALLMMLSGALLLARTRG